MRRKKKSASKTPGPVRLRSKSASSVLKRARLRSKSASPVLKRAKRNEKYAKAGIVAEYKQSSNGGCTGLEGVSLETLLEMADKRGLDVDECVTRDEVVRLLLNAMESDKDRDSKERDNTKYDKDLRQRSHSRSARNNGITAEEAHRRSLSRKRVKLKDAEALEKKVRNGNVNGKRDECKKVKPSEDITLSEAEAEAEAQRCMDKIRQGKAMGEPSSPPLSALSESEPEQG